jgi:hypothetical protein
VVASGTQGIAAKEQVLNVAYAVSAGDAFTRSLREGLSNLSEPDLRYGVLANLVRRNDIRILPEVKALLLEAGLPEQYRRLFEYVVGNSLTDSRALPSIEPLLGSSYSSTRAAAAEAVWHIAAWAGAPAAVSALTDSDQRVRYYSVRALADITGQTEWRPSIPEFQEHEPKYIEHWLDWAKTRR